MFIFFPEKLKKTFKFGGKIFIILILLFIEAEAERLSVRVYTTADALPSGAINRILYDPRGLSVVRHARRAFAV